MAMGDKDLSELERLADDYEFWEILEGLAEVCFLKEGHLVLDYQDTASIASAKVWYKMGRKLADMAEKLK